MHVAYFPDGKNVQNREHCFLLKVTNEDGKGPNIDLECEWQPVADRLGQASNYGVAVTIGDRRYIGAEYPKYPHQTSGWYADSNLICRYLVGKATAEEVKAAAKEFKKDEPLPTQKEQKELRTDVKLLNGALAIERERLKNAEQRVVDLERGCKHASAKIAELQESNGDLYAIALCLYNSAEGQWFKSAALKEAMRAAERAGLDSD